MPGARSIVFHHFASVQTNARIRFGHPQIVHRLRVFVDVHGLPAHDNPMSFRCHILFLSCHIGIGPSYPGPPVMPSTSRLETCPSKG